jgi:hypothetical protein
MDLTLNIDQNIVENVEIYAKYTQKSVSQLVEEYLLSISSKTKIDNNKPLGPITKQLTGIIKLDKNVNYKELLEEALMEKYL